MNAARRLASVFLVVLGVLIGVLAQASAPAFAGTGFGKVSTFSSPQGLDEPVGLAVDDTSDGSKGDVYVADHGDNKIEKFSSAGVLLAEVEVPGAGLEELTVEQYQNLAYEGDVYVVGNTSGVLYRFGPELALKQEIKGLTSPTAVAVDEAGNIFVVGLKGEYSELLEFNSAGEPISAGGRVNPTRPVLNGSVYLPDGLAVVANGEELYVSENFHTGTFRFVLSGEQYQPDGEPLSGGGAKGIAFAPSGNVFVAAQGFVHEFEAHGTKLLADSPPEEIDGEMSGIGVNYESGNVYVANHTQSQVEVFEEGPLPEAPTVTTASPIAPYSATLNGELTKSSGRATTSEYYFSYANGQNCVGIVTATMAASEGKVSAEVSGLKAAKEYTYCIISKNKYGHTQGPSVSFVTGSIPPAIESESFTGVGSSGATLGAVVDPDGLPTTYYFEYGTTTAYGTSTPTMVLGSGGQPLAASTRATQLTPNTAYHFRMVAINADGTEDGSDESFTTAAPIVDGLPDGRVWEQVSPVENQERNIGIPFVTGSLAADGFFGPSSEHPFQSSASGNAIVYPGEQSSPGGNGVSSGLNTLTNQYVARRNPDGGWSQVNLQPSGYRHAFYQAFSSELTTGIISAFSENNTISLPPLSPSAPAGGVDVVYARPLDEARYEPLFTTFPPTRGDEPRTFGAYGVEEPAEKGSVSAPAFAGSSADGSRLLFEANDALTPDAEAGLEFQNNLYESVDGQLRLVNVPAEGPPAAGATFGGFAGIEGNGPDFEHVISEDGSRVFWTDRGTDIIYVRENGEKTVQVSAGSAKYRGATPDGKYVLYIEKHQLWRFDVETESGVALTPEGSTAHVEGVLGMSDDGEYVYFAAEGLLAEGAVEGEENVYLWHEGTTSFIAALGGGEGENVPPYSTDRTSKAGDWAPGLRGRTAEVAPDGKAVVFMSARSLTGYDNTADIEGISREVSEVYAYETEANKLFCVSCSRSGESVTVNEALKYGLSAGYLQVSYSNTYLPHWMSDDGSRVFFDSTQPLVPNDTDNQQSVYEWERDGAGSCQESDGCVYLLSGGADPNTAAWFVDASPSGNDVFFVTRAKLTSEDGGEADVLYDARVGGVQPPVPLACTGTGCQGLPAAPPPFATPASLTFDGVGNFSPSSISQGKPNTGKPLTRQQKLARALKACKSKHQKRKRLACEAQAHKNYGTKSNASKTSRRGK